MTRNLGALGLSISAVLAVSSMSAPAASAQSQGHVVADGTSVKLTATSATGTKSLRRLFGQRVECHVHYTIGNINDTPHGVGNLPATERTVAQDQSNCVGSIGELAAPATVTMNGCDYVWHIGTTIEVGKWGSTTDIVCPAGKQIEAHVYTSATHATTVCTFNIPAQSGLTGGFVRNVAGGKITFGGPIKGIKATRSGVLCGGSAETTTGEEDFDAEVSGTNAAGSSTAIEVTD